MTELQAEQAAVVPRIESRAQRSRYVDVLIALAAFAVLAILPMLTGSEALLDFVSAQRLRDARLLQETAT